MYIITSVIKATGKELALQPTVSLGLFVEVQPQSFLAFSALQ
jgi:hypothetical protein